MCLITFQYKINPDYPLIVVQNRDELYERGSEPIHEWEDHPKILAGRDKNHGGTWSGLTKDGRLAALTNRPFTDFPAPEEPFSRGFLVKDYLTSQITPQEYCKLLKDNRYKYNSYNLLFGSINELHQYTNASDHHHIFEPGLYSLSNTGDDLSNHKINRSKRIVGEYLEKNSTPDLDDLIELFYDNVKAEQLTDVPTDVSIEEAKQNSAIFIEGEEFGSVNTTAISVHKSGLVTMKEVRYDQNGPIETTSKEMKLDDPIE